MKELIHKYLSGETTPEETTSVEQWLAEHPEAARELREMEEIRSAVRRAVGNESLPGDLRESVLKKTVGSRVIPMKKGGSLSSGTSYLYAAVAVVLLLVIGWFALRAPEGDPTGGGEQIAADLKSVREVLNVGMTDHLRCAVTFFKGDVPGYTPEKMEKELAKSVEGLEGDFTPLLPVVRQKIDNGELLVAHKCRFDGRNYVHMIVKSDVGMTSLVITRKREGETLGDREGSVPGPEGIPIHHVRMEDYEIAGFDTDRFLVFVASDLPEDVNLRFAQTLAAPVSEVLKKV